MGRKGVSKRKPQKTKKPFSGEQGSSGSTKASAAAAAPLVRSSDAGSVSETKGNSKKR